VGECPLHLLDRPWALAGKLPQGLHVGADPCGHRFDGFAFTIEREPLEIFARPPAALAAPHRGEQFLKEIGESSIESRECFRVHETAACGRATALSLT